VVGAGIAGGGKEDAEGECDERKGDNENVSAALARGVFAVSEPVGVEVTQQKRGLEEDEAGEPDGGGSSEDGEELLGGEGLNEEEQEGREKGGAAVEKAV
jgi:hypothetical protein